MENGDCGLWDPGGAFRGGIGLMDQLGVRLLRVLGWLLCSAAVPLSLSPMHGYVFRKASDP